MNDPRRVASRRRNKALASEFGKVVAQRIANGELPVAPDIRLNPWLRRELESKGQGVILESVENEADYVPSRRESDGEFQWSRVMGHEGWGEDGETEEEESGEEEEGDGTLDADGETNDEDEEIEIQNVKRESDSEPAEGLIDPRLLHTSTSGDNSRHGSVSVLGSRQIPLLRCALCDRQYRKKKWHLQTYHPAKWARINPRGTLPQRELAMWIDSMLMGIDLSALNTGGYFEEDEDENWVPPPRPLLDLAPNPNPIEIIPEPHFLGPLSKRWELPLDPKERPREAQRRKHFKQPKPESDKTVEERIADCYGFIAIEPEILDVAKRHVGDRRRLYVSIMPKGSNGMAYTVIDGNTTMALPPLKISEPGALKIQPSGPMNPALYVPEPTLVPTTAVLCGVLPVPVPMVEEIEQWEPEPSPIHEIPEYAQIRRRVSFARIITPANFEENEDWIEDIPWLTCKTYQRREIRFRSNSPPGRWCDPFVNDRSPPRIFQDNYVNSTGVDYLTGVEITAMVEESKKKDERDYGLRWNNPAGRRLQFSPPPVVVQALKAKEEKRRAKKEKLKVKEEKRRKKEELRKEKAALRGQPRGRRKRAEDAPIEEDAGGSLAARLHAAEMKRTKAPKPKEFSWVQETKDSWNAFVRPGPGQVPKSKREDWKETRGKRRQDDETLRRPRRRRKRPVEESQELDLGDVINQDALLTTDSSLKRRGPEDQFERRQDVDPVDLTQQSMMHSVEPNQNGTGNLPYYIPDAESRTTEEALSDTESTVSSRDMAGGVEFGDENGLSNTSIDINDAVQLADGELDLLEEFALAGGDIEMLDEYPLPRGEPNHQEEFSMSDFSAQALHCQPTPIAEYLDTVFPSVEPNLAQPFMAFQEQPIITIYKEPVTAVNNRNENAPASILMKKKETVHSLGPTDPVDEQENISHSLPALEKERARPAILVDLTQETEKPPNPPPKIKKKKDRQVVPGKTPDSSLKGKKKKARPVVPADLVDELEADPFA